MRSASSTVGVERGFDVAVPRPRPAQFLVVANMLSLSRGLLAVALFVLGVADVPMWIIIAVGGVMWSTDVLDGLVARAGHRRGAEPRSDGAALDPMMDDLGFIAGFLILLDAGAIPIAFAAFLFASRVVFAVVRFARLAQESTFAASEPITKANGATLAGCQLLLLAHLGSSGGFIASNSFAMSLVVVMTITSVISVLHFVCRRHWGTLAALVRT